MKIVRLIPLETPPARAAEVLCSEGYNLEREKAREEVVSTSFHLVERGTERTVFELRSVEYKRTMTGAIDRAGTAESVTRSTWTPGDQTLRWTYEGGPAPARMRLGGVYRLAERNGRSQLTHEITIEVKVPLIGEKIAKIAGREFERSAVVYEEILRRRAREAGGG